MTEAPSGGNDGDDGDDWLAGRTRFDQKAYDSLPTWFADWVKYFYQRDLSGQEARARIAKSLVSDPEVRRRIAGGNPTFMIGQPWLVNVAYLYTKNAAAFHASCLSSLDAAVRAFVIANINGWRDVYQGKQPPPGR